MQSIVHSILLSHRGIPALERLIALKKMENSAYTKNYLTRRVGLSSRGYLTDVFKERKKLSARFVRPLVAILDLEPFEATYLEKKLLLETEYAKSAEVREELQAELTILEKNFRSMTLEVEDNFDVYALSLVYLSLFLFPEKTAGHRDLLKVLPILPAATIERSLQFLLQKSLIVEQGHRLTVNPDKDFSFLSAQYSAGQEADYLKKSFMEGIERLPLLRQQRDDVIFHSSVLTVKRSAYREFIKRIKQDFRTYHAELDHENPDALVRFNVQLYPL
ncbi:MAG: TIGR02147 family protein [Pseudobdellovibrionaceae bacterium]|nr:TIGR02147 family protein [Pseudobdellovibrionaceae bacterium]